MAKFITMGIYSDLGVRTSAMVNEMVTVEVGDPEKVSTPANKVAYDPPA